MVLPLVPIAGAALKYGAVAVAAYAVSRQIPHAPRDQKAEDALDRVDEGLAMARETDGLRATGRFRRVIRFGQNGPGVEIDATGIGRFSIRKVDA